MNVTVSQLNLAIYGNYNKASGEDMGKVYRQKCWTCTHSCSMYECIWVETLNKEKAIKKQGCVFDNEGFIISCNKYKKEQQQNYTKKLKALALGINYKKYLNLEKEIIKFGLKTTPEELYKMQTELKEEKQEKEQAKERKKQEKQEFEKWREDKALQKEIDKAMAKEFKITYKRFLEMKENAKEQNITIEQYIAKFKHTKSELQEKENANKIGISISYYYHLKRMIKGTNKSVEEYLQEREQCKQLKAKQIKESKERSNEEKKQNSIQSKAFALGITTMYYYSLQREIRKLGLNISVEKYIKQKRECTKFKRIEILKQARAKKTSEPTQKEKAEKLGVNLYKYKDLVKEIKRKGLNISPEELYKQKQEKKKNKVLTKSNK